MSYDERENGGENDRSKKGRIAKFWFRASILIICPLLIAGGIFFYIQKTTPKRLDELESTIINQIENSSNCQNMKTLQKSIFNKHFSDVKIIDPKKLDENITKFSADLLELKIGCSLKIIEDYVSYLNKINLADIFFYHSIVLILIVSGIFGLFWLFISWLRDIREKEAAVERELIRTKEEEREKKIEKDENIKKMEDKIKMLEFEKKVLQKYVGKK